MSSGDRKVALVTGGGGGGIGGGICAALAEAGWHVVVGDVDFVAARRVAKEVDGQAVELDVADAASVASAVAGLDRIDGLVASAGVGLVSPVAAVTPEEFDRVMAVDVRGTWLCCRAAIPRMVAQGGGSIVAIGSNHALASVEGFGVYAAAKAALVSLCRGIAIDYGPDGVRANVVHPGLVDGPVSRQHLANAYGDASVFMDGWTTRRQAIPNPIDPIDIGRVVAFLLSDASRAITGHAVPADAGTTSLLIDKDLP